MIIFVKGSVKSLRSYNGEDIVLTLPGGKTLKDIRYLYNYYSYSLHSWFSQQLSTEINY